MPKIKAKSGYLKHDINKHVFSSKSEAIYYMHLCDELAKGNIKKFRYEVRRFRFRTSTLTYLCDFEVWGIDGSYKVIEVKGKMSSRDHRLKKLLKKEYQATDIRYVFVESSSFQFLYGKYKLKLNANFVEQEKEKRRKGELLNSLNKSKNGINTNAGGKRSYKSNYRRKYK